MCKPVLIVLLYLGDISMKPCYVMALAALAGMALACARPLGPDDQPITEGPAGRTYTNRSLGFQITIPSPLDASWGLSVQTLHHTGVLADGTSLSLFITGPRGRGDFQPTFTLDPYPVSRNVALADVGVQVAQGFAANYRNYRETAHRGIEVAGGPAERWTFTAQTSSRADRYTVTLVLNGRLAYLLQGNGIEGYYPTDVYESILKTFKFL
jgi:hypothetical protein